MSSGGGGEVIGSSASLNGDDPEKRAPRRVLCVTSDGFLEDEATVALAALKSNNDQAVLSVESVRESQNAYDIAKARFDAGAVDYLNLLETQRALYQAQDNQVSIAEGQFQAFVQLRKALGT
jgi:hypothetical protein